MLSNLINKSLNQLYNVIGISGNFFSLRVGGAFHHIVFDLEYNYKRYSSVKLEGCERLMLKTMIGAVVASLVYSYTQNHLIDVEEIMIKIEALPEALEGFKIVHLTDVHLPKQASNIEKMIRMVKNQEPDLIVMTGDILDRPADITKSKLDELCKGLMAIADVYAVSGNHEKEGANYFEWLNVLKSHGVVLLENDYKVIKRESAQLAIIGLEDGKQYETDFLNEAKIREDDFKLLLVHRPVVWEKDYPKLKQVQPHLIFNGHEHGGQVRIPFLGGICSHEQGIFPKYSSGVYAIEEGRYLIMSRGLGSSSFPLRVNNRPHLPVVTLTKNNK